MKVQDQMASKMKSIKYLEELTSIFLKNIPKNYSGRNTSELSLENHHFPDTKIKQKYHRKENYMPISLT